MLSKLSKSKKYRGLPVGALAYWSRHGREHCAAMCVEAGTTYAYWKRVCNLRVRPGMDLARRLVELSGGEMSFELLCPPKGSIRGIGAAPMPGGNRVGAIRKVRADAAVGAVK